MVFCGSECALSAPNSLGARTRMLVLNESIPLTSICTSPDESGPGVAADLSCHSLSPLVRTLERAVLISLLLPHPPNY